MCCGASAAPVVTLKNGDPGSFEWQRRDQAV
jgi:hypothetical protein